VAPFLSAKCGIDGGPSGRSKIGSVKKKSYAIDLHHSKEL
jgi:hypothetical protein